MRGSGSEPVFGAPRPRVFSIEPHRPFLKMLAEGLREALSKSGEETLAGAVIYLPTRRAVRALTDEFLAASARSATILPSIRALGDVQEDEFIAFAGAVEDEIALPPAVSAAERRVALARLVAARDRAFFGHERWAGALGAADELGKLLDSLYTEEVDPNSLAQAAPPDLAAHWAQSLHFLEIVTRAWPAHLSESGCMDPADRRVKLIDRQRRHWEAKPPETPVVIAGSTGSTPAVMRLMKTVAHLPRGCVVLPGLDRTSDQEVWNKIDDPHPQSGLKHLLENGLKMAREAVATWPGAADGDRAFRSEMFQVALRPADASDSWRDWTNKAKSGMSSMIDGLALVEAADEEREADAIAVRLREVAETKAQRAFLSTPDRDLARRVSNKLRRWNINVDDSAGVPFANTPCGVFLRLVARWLAEPGDVVALMAVLRHPLFGGGLERGRRRAVVNHIDSALRGPAPAGGLSGVIARVAASGAESEAAAALLSAYGERLSSSRSANMTCGDYFAAHLELAEALATTDAIASGERLWRGDDGATGAAQLAQLRAVLRKIETLSSAEYPDIFDQVIAPVTVRRPGATHPRISIFGPLEARLQWADVVILGGLNEGVWPKDAVVDPFLSRGMRRKIGLPSPEQRVGLAAHDFAQLAAAPSVMLTRAVKADGKPTTPSRWIVRLKNILEGAGILSGVDRTHHYAVLAERLERAPRVEIDPPAPRPPVDARPTSFYVTRIEKLMRDPYAVFARDILGLRKLDGLDEAVSMRHVGGLFHAVFERYAAGNQPENHDARVNRLIALFDAIAENYSFGHEHRAFWRTRAEESFDWFARWDAAQRKAGRPAVIEARGEWSFDHEGRRFTLGAKADRIDLTNEGAAVIFDYKTGAPPPTEPQEKTFSPQLPLTALIARHGGFEQLGAVDVKGFAYVKVINRKGDVADTRALYGDDCRQASENAERGLKALLTHFLDPSSAYLSQPRPQFLDAFGDYDHLARRRERHAQEGDA